MGVAPAAEVHRQKIVSEANRRSIFLLLATFAEFAVDIADKSLDYPWLLGGGIGFY